MVKKCLLALALIGFADLGYAYKVPRDVTGYPASTIMDVGVDVITATDSYVSGSTIAIWGVLTATAPAGTLVGSGALGAPYVEIRSTNAITSSTTGIGSVGFSTMIVINAVTMTGELLLPRIYFSSETHNTFVRFYPPILSPGGFHFATSSHGALATVFYRHVATGTNENFLVPYDVDGHKGGAWDFYGVSVASETAPGQLADGVGTESLDGVTAARLIGFGTGTITGPGLVYDIICGTVAPTTYVMTKDYAYEVGVGTQPHWIVPIFPGTFQAEHRNTNVKTSVVNFGFPLKYLNQMAVIPSAGIGQLRVRTRLFRGFK